MAKRLTPRQKAKQAERRKATQNLSRTLNSRIRDTLKMAGTELTEQEVIDYKKRLLSAVPKRFINDKGNIVSTKAFGDWAFGKKDKKDTFTRGDLLLQSVLTAGAQKDRLLKQAAAGDTYTNLQEKLDEIEKETEAAEAIAEFKKEMAEFKAQMNLKRQAFIAEEIKARAEAAKFYEDDWDLVYQVADGDYPDIETIDHQVRSTAIGLVEEGFGEGKYYDKNDANFWIRIRNCAERIRQVLNELGIK